MKILQRNLNRSTFVVWEMKRNVSAVRLIVATRSNGPPNSQPACFLPDAPLCWSLCHLTEGAYTIWLFVSVSVCVSSHRKVGKCIGIFWRSEPLLSGSVASGTHCTIIANINRQTFIQNRCHLYPEDRGNIFVRNVIITCQTQDLNSRYHTNKNLKYYVIIWFYLYLIMLCWRQEL